VRSLEKQIEDLRMTMEARMADARSINSPAHPRQTLSQMR
jgi:hypothetical protein